jgi:hypothetical protein
VVGHDGTDRVALAVVGLLSQEDDIRVLGLENLGKGQTGGADIRADEGVVRSAPSATAAEGRWAEPGPIVTATTSSTASSPPSLSCMAASMAWVSKGLRLFSPLRSSRMVPVSMRFCTAASGTSFTRTQIFK